MKKLMCLLVAGLTALSLCACAEKKEQTVYTVAKGDAVYTVDTENGTISDGTDLYRYEISFGGGSGSWRIDVTYPDGSTYWWEETENSGTGRCSADFEYGKYPDAAALADVVKKARPDTGRYRGSPGLGAVLLTVGLFNAITPRTSWYLSRGWYYKNAEPSEAALFVYRAGGVFAAVLGVVLFFV